jgi:cytochrome c-type biogenesis protein CcmH/NrfF
MAPPVTPETLLLAVAYVGVFAGLYLVVMNLPWFGDDEDARAAEEGGETVRCPQCGRENEDGFAYCRHCTTALGGGTAGAA